MLETQLYSKSKNRKRNIIRIIFKSIQKMLKKTWDGIKSIVIMNSKDKTAPNSVIVSENVITFKNCITEIFNDFLNLVQILRPKTEKKKNFQYILKKQ